MGEQNWSLRRLPIDVRLLDLSLATMGYCWGAVQVVKNWCSVPGAKWGSRVINKAGDGELFGLCSSGSQTWWFIVLSFSEKMRIQKMQGTK